MPRPWAAAGAEDGVPGAVGHGQIGHVFNDSCDPAVCLLAICPARSATSADAARGGHYDDLGLGDQLSYGQGDIAGARRKVKQQHVEIAPVNVREELLQSTMQHRPAPDHRESYPE